jgi:hypothetical protein
MKNYTEDALQRVISANNEGMGLRKAVKLWGILLTILYDRVNSSKLYRVIAEAC